MECRDFVLQLDDLLDGGLDAAGQKPVQEHLGRCPDCRSRHEHALAVREAVRKLSPPAMHPGFIDQTLARATRAVGSPNPRWRRPVLGMAVAATLVLGVALGGFLATRARGQTVALTIDQPGSVRLMVNSAE